MSMLTEHIGGRIRLYRKKKNISILQLATAINKSKSAVSKYEQGTIAIDVETLFDLAQALSVSVQQLIDFSPPTAAVRKTYALKKRLFDCDHMYLYFYDGRKRQLTRGYIELFADPHGEEDMVTLYLACESLAQYTQCRHLYNGHIHRFDTLARIILVNQSNSMEQIVINIPDALGHDDMLIAHLTGISNHPLAPISMKCLLSNHVLNENDELHALLKLNGDDFKVMRRFNMFYVTQL